MKTRTNKLFLTIFSVMLGLYFLNISINFYSFFGFPLQVIAAEIFSPDNEAYLIQADFDNSNTSSDTGSGSSNNTPAEEEEEKKVAHDDCLTLQNRYIKLVDEIYLQRFHGINLTGEFISEIVPPPPKA